MPGHEVLSRGMNAIVYLSYTGNTRKVAEHLAKKAGWPLFECGSEGVPSAYENLLFLAPVHGERLPKEALEFLSRASMSKIAILATFGRIWHGNAIEDAIKKTSLPLVGAMYLPAPHCYLPEDGFRMPLEETEAILLSFGQNGPLALPEEQDTFGRWFFPRWRARVGARVVLRENCIGCNNCERSCHFHAICAGKVDERRCIRCGACVKACPEGALALRLSPFLRRYLRNRRDEKVTIYLAD